jgi:hypothetical protein
METPSFGIQLILPHRIDQPKVPDCWQCAWNPVLSGEVQTTGPAIKPMGSQLFVSSKTSGLRRALHRRVAANRQTQMLRITLQEDGTLLRVHLAGRLAGAWVAETENTWRCAQVCGKPVEIDIREVTGIDEAGRCLLRAMNQEGASLVAKGVAMKALVEEITGIPVRRRRG